jgi:hypothetical protein
MDCQNINLKQLLEDSEKLKDLQKKYNNIQKNITIGIKAIEDFINSYAVGHDQKLRLFYNNEPTLENLKADFGNYVIQGINLTFDKDNQIRRLVAERKEYNEIFIDQQNNFEQEMQWQRDQLVSAWEKFRELKSKAYLKTIEEIKNENI